MPPNDARAMRHARRDEFLRSIAAGPTIMGVLNITPDSFSDGGRYQTPDAAAAQARLMADTGAAIIDVGAESTRPGHTPLAPDVEWARLERVLPHLIRTVEAPFSIDTSKASVARRALGFGVAAVNDVWGLQRDPQMAPLVAEAQAALVIMHNRESVDAHLDILDDIRRFFDRSLALARAAGIDDRHILLDPGIGFGKTTEQNLVALRSISSLAAYGLPLLVGVSRKSLLGRLLGAEVGDRLVGSLAAHLAAVSRGAGVLRVHDVGAHRAALNVWQAIARA